MERRGMVPLLICAQLWTPIAMPKPIVVTSTTRRRASRYPCRAPCRAACTALRGLWACADESKLLAMMTFSERWRSKPGSIIETRSFSAFALPDSRIGDDCCRSTLGGSELRRSPLSSGDDPAA